jgi:dienelactone hydrolase
MRRVSLRLVGLVGVAAVGVGTAVLSRPYTRAASFVVRSAGQQQAHPWIARWHVQPFAERENRIPTRHGEARARSYLPGRSVERAVLLVPGVNALAIDEPRLVAFARALAASGLAVVTPEVEDLKGYRVTPRCTDVIEDALVWLDRQSALTGGRRIGVIGISFAGGLSIVAASRPAVRDRVAWVFAFGGHGNFQRVLRYLCTGEEDAGTPGEPSSRGEHKRANPPGPQAARARTPHDYGLAVLTYDIADRLVPADQTELLRTAVLTFLEASHLALYDRSGAERTFERARTMEAELPDPARSLMRLVNTRDVTTLGARLLPHLAALGDDPAVSPDRSPAPAAPVFLLHGTDDTVVPASETIRIAAHLDPRTRVRWLLSPLISHAEIDRNARWRDIWDLVRFWAAILGA